jgi:glycosyltransferase involved in cell wall biosynthesis
LSPTNEHQGLPTAGRGFTWRFAGFVDDVRRFLRRASASVIPLRIGGGTQLKAYEAMAMRSPVVSTGIGVEGLPVSVGGQVLHADTRYDFAAAVVSILRDRTRRKPLSNKARRLVEARFSRDAAARAFKGACDLARTRRGLAA